MFTLIRLDSDVQVLVSWPSFHPKCRLAAQLRAHYLAQYPGDLVGLAMLLWHSSLDTARLYSQPEVSQLVVRVEQLALNAYSK